jgi:hypothetical protein
MSAVVLQESDVRIPGWVVDLESFNRWVDADDFPDEGRICYLRGEVWVDMSWQQIFSHVEVKTEFTYCLGSIAKRQTFGPFFVQRMGSTSE